jgi:phosphatidate cytidylyltransferase
LLFFLSSQIPGLPIVIFLSFFLFIALLFYFRFKEMQGSLIYIGVSSFGLFYITIPLGLIFLILYQESGRLWFSYALIVTKVTDIGGYFGGKAFGKRPLCLVSPKKTKEGAIIGLLCAIVFSYLFTILANNYGFGLNPLISILIGCILGSFGQLGDLSESLLKRDAEIKDSSNIPGLGGILDMLDSLLFNIPIIYFIIEALK